MDTVNSHLFGTGFHCLTLYMYHDEKLEIYV